MPDFPTFSSLFRVARDKILTINPQLSRSAVERDGMDANILIAGAAAVGDEVVGQVQDAQAGLFLDSAVGPALDRYVFDRYGLIRKPAAAALGSVQFTTATASPTTFAIPAGVLLQTTDGIQFQTISAAIFVAGSTGPLTVDVRSVQAGANQNAKANSITNISGTITGSPANLAVANVFATAGAADAETDDSLKNRARNFFLTARRGTIPSIQQQALAYPGVQTASVFEFLDALGRPARQLQLIIADTFTEQFMDTSVVPPTYQIQSQLLAVNVFNSLSDTRGGGIFVQVIVANVILQAFQLALTFIAGADTNQAALQARAAVVNYVNSLDPGASWSPGNINVRNSALGQLALVPGLKVTGNEFVSPAGIISVLPLQVLRTSLGLVAAVAAQSNQPVIVTGSNPDAFVVGG